MEAWFTRGEDGKVVIDPDLAYPRYLKIVGAGPTVGGLELARRVFTEDLRQTLGAPLHLQILKCRRWALARFPDATGKDEALLRQAVGAFERFYKALPGTPATRIGLV